MPFSDMDVRALKSLYGFNNATPRTPGSPHSPLADGTTATLGVEAFALRMQAFIADDRASIERLIRFAQAHDSLKKNVGRVQKLAQDITAFARDVPAPGADARGTACSLGRFVRSFSHSKFELLMSETGIALPARCRTGGDTLPGRRSKRDAVLASVRRDWLCWKRSNSCKRLRQISCVCYYGTWGHSDFFVPSANAAMLCLFIPCIFSFTHLSVYLLYSFSSVFYVVRLNVQRCCKQWF